MNSFEKMNQQGLKVQEIVKNHLETRGNILKDVSQDKDYQKKDIDFLVYKDGEMTTLEVKKDKSLYRTGNIFLECGAYRGDNYSAGWLFYCEADYIAIYDTTARKGIIVDRLQLLPLLEQGKIITYYDKIDDKNCKAVLLPMRKAANAIIYKWED